jgi:alpha-ketoglutarate-dependent taurine dioxygenase
MRFRHEKDPGWRYDEHCMVPVNEAATIAHAELPQMLARCEVHEIDWSGNLALIIDNWQTLHGRGEEPPAEQLRILQRIYVE